MQRITALMDDRRCKSKNAMDYRAAYFLKMASMIFGDWPLAREKQAPR
jgi:hypothetical protein